MYLTRLALDDFRSWQNLLIDVTPGITVLYGANGLGKTNIVEAIEVLATGTSHRAHSTIPLIRAGQQKATIRANVINNDESQTTYEISLAAKGANRARINGGKSVYMRDVVGQIPVVAFAPDDQQLVTQDPSLRRSFINQAGALLNPDYYAILQQYMQVAKQRVALLKTLQHQDEGFDISATLQNLEIWTGQFIELGLRLTLAREQIIHQLAEPFTRIYSRLTSGDTSARIIYAPSFEEVQEQTPQESTFQGSYHQETVGSEDITEHDIQSIKANISEHFRRIYAGEVARGQNLIGPHRDDVLIELHGFSAKEYASNGEAWTLALALKMALCEVLEQQLQSEPIIILDDVFAQLDMNRREQIMEFAQQKTQVFITMAALRDLPDGMEAQLIDVERCAQEQIASQHDEMMHLVANMVKQKSQEQA
ncbi:DNA replication and repair protein RecF [Galliscardovia ingluviei]|uniref:DNA replication and repair protein RecF n=1 Tax=Galliscardovia ingluviei TaxID=1769422 RepID=A0A8J3F038_9BIFI|nr:DNA replication and repair protein RecF [Galliscardovia ingluviei]GGI15061.1 DNA replication and repair protein RecF [Galliscardovia ingluviei]